MRRRSDRAPTNSLPGFLVGVLVVAACASPVAAECTLGEGRATHRVEVDGVSRTYHVRVGPDAHLAAKAPVVFLWHGFGSNGRQIAPAFDPARVWPGAIVVAPEGLPRAFPGFGPTQRAGWQIAAGELGDRDLAFFDALVVDVSRRYCADPARLYSTGFSNGGFFSNLLGCRRPEVLAAIAPVSGGGPFPPSCARAIPVRVAHGRSDDVVPYQRGVESFAFWRGEAGCSETVDEAANGCLEGASCGVEVAMCPFQGRHTWPFRDVPDMVAFFERHARTASEPEPQPAPPAPPTVLEGAPR